MLTTASKCFDLFPDFWKHDYRNGKRVCMPCFIINVGVTLGL